MDILQFLRSWSQTASFRVQSLSPEDLVSGESKAAAMSYLSELSRKIDADRQYLVPELFELSSKGQYAATLLASHLDKLSALLACMCSPDQQSLEELRAASLALRESLTTYDEILLEKVLPLLRASMSAEDREDLFHLFQDLMTENEGRTA